MRIPRIYHTGSLAVGQVVALSVEATQHLVKVLRLKNDAPLILFNGDNHQYDAVLLLQGKKAVAKIVEKHFVNRESGLNIQIVQGISRGSRMDYTIQKAVELGVNAIFPVVTLRGNVKLSEERAENRLQHWQKVAQSACEQCGRNIVPIISPPQSLVEWLVNLTTPALRLVLAVGATETLKDITILPENQTIILLIGPEGGLSEEEVQMAEKMKFSRLSLGPRVLRTETAAVVAMSIAQAKWGDI